MKKIVAALALAFSLTGCITVQPEAPAETQKTQAPKTQETTQAPEEDIDGAFASLIRQEIPAVSPMSDEQIIEIGKQICTDLQMASSKDELMAYMAGFYSEVKDIMTEYQTGYLIGAAVGAYCPEKGNLVEGLGT